MYGKQRQLTGPIEGVASIYFSKCKTELSYPGIECIPPCGSNETCLESDGFNTCFCNEGFLRNGSTCESMPKVDITADLIIANFSSDINECANEAYPCDYNAFCTDTIGSYDCTCYGGFTGNGTFCDGKLSLHVKRQVSHFSQLKQILMNVTLDYITVMRMQLAIIAYMAGTHAYATMDQQEMDTTANVRNAYIFLSLYRGFNIFQLKVKAAFFTMSSTAR